MDNLTDEQVEQLNNELVRRFTEVRGISTKDAMIADWKMLMADEASRKYFLRMLSSVACWAGMAAISGQFHECTHPMKAFQGAKDIMRYVVASSIAEDMKDGKFKFKD